MKRILIVDDEASIREGLTNAIRRLCDFDGEIMAVETGREAVREVSLRPYHGCFLDIELPDINGLYVLKQIQEASPETKIAMISASTVNDEMMKTFEKSDAMFIAKPFAMENVKAFLEKACCPKGED